MKQDTIDAAKRLARNLRTRQTRAEKLFWDVLRNRRFHGKKFLRQHPFVFEDSSGEAFFIADFYCHEHRLVVELDGRGHITQHEYDDFRTDVLNSIGISVVRFRNEDVESKLEHVLKKLEQSLTQPPVPPSLSKRRGRG